jgi:hypothetical protein
MNLFQWSKHHRPEKLSRSFAQNVDAFRFQGFQMVEFRMVELPMVELKMVKLNVRCHFFRP